ncbi:hypothetical protein BOX15_Mlig018481g1 [Macrostomum lignano]|uniref:Uncharacterized protein n=1 Tax=Macrostomum lignano TaxID=282301 RepID=A0A267FAX0_9PLAT|nr:hypothetical protein BOX15_Mlig018481g1 [Macrostomum lignano]
MAPARKAAIVESPTVGPPLYFSVIYADNQTAMFNIACQKEHLVSAIRRRCRIERKAEIDLWAITRGELLKLTDRSNQDCLSDIIQSRDAAILCKLEASKYPGVESRLVPMISDLQSYPALRDLADSINKQVSDREAKIEQRQQAAMKRASRYTSAQKQGADGSEQAASSVGLTKGRMAIKRIMIINKMTKRS